MSLNTLAANHVAREVATANQLAFDDTVGLRGENAQNALSALVEYIPTETITLYIALLASFPVVSKVLPWLSLTGIYWGLALLTPVLFGLILAGKRRARGKPRWQGWKNWPWWLMFASFAAFLAWGIAIPDGPYLTDENGRVLGSLIALVASTLLGVGGRFCGSSEE